MAFITDIMNAIEELFHVRIYGNSKENETIDGMQYIEESSMDKLSLNRKILYVVRYQEGMINSKGAKVLIVNYQNNQEKLSDDVLYIKEDIDLLAIGNCIQQELWKSQQRYLRKSEMLKIMQENSDIDRLIAYAHRYINNPVTVCSTGFSMIETYPKDFGEEKFISYKGKQYLKEDCLQNMKNSNVITQLTQSTVPSIVCFPDEPEVRYLFCSIKVKHAVIGYLCIPSVVRAFTKQDYNFAMDLSEALSVQMQRNNFYFEKLGLSFEYLLTDIIERKLEDENLARQQLKQLGQTLHTYHWVLAFSFAKDFNSQIKPSHYIDQLSVIFQGRMIFLYKGAIIIILSGRDKEPFEGIDIQRCMKYLELNQLRAALSYRYENITDTYRYYDQAMFLLKSNHIQSEERILFFEKSFHQYILQQCTEPYKLIACIHPDIQCLQKHDQKYHTEYLLTLKTYLQHNRNAGKVSQALHIHKSTFFYRIGKIKELTEFELENSKILLAYELSFQIMEYLESKHTKI